ncbi:MAG TPA: 5-formyltetrahydrofolate cyclo-ligase [Taishania sp.]|nr:5-formyltetrahydrofolate cyclo-ligase [Taishania sp.]
MIKSDCRKLFLEKRKQISAEERTQLSQKICDTLIHSFDFTGRNVSLFLPIESKHEVDTFLIINKLKQVNSIIGLPIADFQTNTIKHYIYESLDQLKISEYGIPEPVYGKELNPEEIEFVIVPLLCADFRGYRVGYGKGFYDRLLDRVSEKCITIGISYFELIDQIDDINEFDKKLMYYCSPTQFIQF